MRSICRVWNTAIITARPPQITGARSGLRPFRSMVLNEPKRSNSSRRRNMPPRVISPLVQSLISRMSRSERAVPEVPTASCHSLCG
ncbi:hypothetical protein D3C85_1120040 [compost metagenome]